MSLRVPRSLATLFAIGVLATASAAQGAPSLIHLQARLADSGGSPLAGPVSLDVRIYDAASGGTMLWSETHAATALNGVVSLELGATSAFPANLFDGGDRWMAFQVEADPEMVPRRRVVAVAYAVSAQSAATAEDVPGMDITPNSVTVNGTPVVNSSGQWTGPTIPLAIEANDVPGKNITPNTVTVNGTPVIDSAGTWVGPQIASAATADAATTAASAATAAAADDVPGKNITPNTITINGTQVIDATGAWTGPQVPSAVSADTATTATTATSATSADDVPGMDITPNTITVNGTQVIDATGAWTGPAVPSALLATTAVSANDVPGQNITPNSITVNGTPVINSAGNWVGPQVPSAAAADTATTATSATSADDVPGKDITPNTITVNGTPVIDATGAWTGPQVPSAVAADSATSATSADDVPGKDITPNTVTVNGTPVIDATGAWTGPQVPSALAADTATSATSADDVPGMDITPNSVTINGTQVIDSDGDWVGPAGPFEPQDPTAVLGTVAIPALSCPSANSIDIFSLTHEFKETPSGLVSTVVFTKDFDDCSTLMLLGTNTGVAPPSSVFTIGDFELTVRNPVIFSIELKELEGHEPREEVSFVYNQAEWEWTGTGGNNSSLWNLPTDTGSASNAYTGGTQLDYVLFDQTTNPAFTGLEISAFQHGVARTVSGYGTTGLPDHQELRVVKTIDFETPSLFHAVGAETVLGGVRVDVTRNESGTETAYLTYELSNPVVQRVTIEFTDEQELIEKVDFSYDVITWTYHEGEPDEKTNFWDVPGVTGG